MKKYILAVSILLFSSFSPAKPELKLRTVTLSMANTAYISETIDAASFEKDLSHILFKRATLDTKKTLYVVIPSYGGIVDYAYALADILSQVPNVELICKYCASAAGAIFELTPHKRLIIANSQMLMHEMAIPRFTARDITKERLLDLRNGSEVFNKIFYIKMGLTKDEYEKRIAGRDWTVNASEMLKLGLADELVKIKCDEYIAKILPDTCGE